MDVYSERSYSTPLSNSTLLPLLLLTLAKQKHVPKISKTFNEQYDYIVVGGGASGSVVASRLSEMPCVNVLLLEVGHEPPLLTEVPAIASYFWNTDIDWKFQTVPQRHAAYGRINRQIGYASGKMLGGSSSFNYLFYIRGNRKNFDHWEEQGAEGWGYENIFPYFLKLEDNRNATYLANGYHSVGGPITVEQPRYHPELKQAVLDAARNLGYEFVDSNAERQTGFFDQQANVRNNQRCSTVKAYLVPAGDRENLDILLNSMVTKIIIEDGRAKGVEFITGGETFVVRASKEVIISAGAVNTPKLLMLSGIGPREELEKFGIPVIADLPVGKNFHDHGGMDFPFTMDSRFESFNEKLEDPSSIVQFVNQRAGPLVSTAGFINALFVNGLNILVENDFPLQEIYFGELIPTSEEQSGLKPEVYRQFYGPYENQPIFSCVIHLLQPRSRGTVTLKSRNPFDSPLIDPNYLEDAGDLDNFVDGLKVCRRFLNTAPMLELGAKAFETLVPGCEMYARSEDEDEYLRCYARFLLTTSLHGVGTCKMGKSYDPSTVVDPKLRVKNIEGLRVVDASVMPTVTSGNIHIPTVMIAEKAADMIKESITCLPFGVNSYGTIAFTENNHNFNYSTFYP